MGDELTYADLSSVSWNERLDVVLMVSESVKFSGFPTVKAWHERMISRSSWRKCMEIRARLMDEQGLIWNGMPKGIENMEQDMESIKKKEEKECG